MYSICGWLRSYIRLEPGLFCADCLHAASRGPRHHKTWWSLERLGLQLDVVAGFVLGRDFLRVVLLRPLRILVCLVCHELQWDAAF